MLRKDLYRKFEGFILFLIIKSFWFFLKVLPTSFGMFFCTLLGKLSPYIVRKSYNRSCNQIKERLDCTSDFAKNTSKKIFHYMAISICELVYTLQKRFSVKDVVDFPDEEIIKRLLSKKKGLLWISAHYGNWELIPLKIANLGYKVLVVVSSIRYPLLNNLMLKLRSLYGIDLFIKGKSHSEELKNSLLNGTIVGVLLDQDTKGRGLMVPFLGKDAYTLSTSVNIAVSLGSPIVIGLIHRNSVFKHTVKISIISSGEEIFSSCKTSSDDKTYIDSAYTHLKKYSEILESTIKSNPCYWVWFHMRWKRRI